MYFGFLKTVDFNITIFLQKIISGSLATPFSLFSIIGSVEFATAILLLILLLFKKLNKLNILSLYAIFTLVEVAGKSFIRQIPPPIEFLKTDIHLFLPVSDAVPKEFFSYPSGHSSRTAFISGVLLLGIWNSRISKKQKYIWTFFVLAFDFIMFLSRVYLGEHWITDVIGGMLLGFSFAFLYPFLASKFNKIKV